MVIINSVNIYIVIRLVRRISNVIINQTVIRIIRLTELLLLCIDTRDSFASHSDKQWTASDVKMNLSCKSDTMSHHILILLSSSTASLSHKDTVNVPDQHVQNHHKMIVTVFGQQYLELSLSLDQHPNSISLPPLYSFLSSFPTRTLTYFKGDNSLTLTVADTHVSIS